MTWPQPISGECFTFHLVTFGPSLLLKIRMAPLLAQHMVQVGTINYGIPSPMIKRVSEHVTNPGQSESSCGILGIWNKGKRISHLSGKEARRHELGIAVGHSSSLERKVI